jgi:hypothetical protein
MRGSGGRRYGLHWLYTVHLWVGIAVALQLLLWTASGLFMSSTAIETVRGQDLRKPPVVVDLRGVSAILPVAQVLNSPTETAELAILLGRPVWKLKSGDTRWLVEARTGRRWTLTAADAVAIAHDAITLEGAAQATPVGTPPPLELRRPGAAWRVTWADGTHVYMVVTGDIMAVRTDLWRWYDFAWGVHILDPGGREDTHHPLLIASASLSLASVVSGIILIIVHFRRRR